MVSWVTRAASSGWPTWPAVQRHPWPISAAAASHDSALRLVIITSAPASANVAAIAFPMPREPPVTRAVRSSSRSSIS